MQAQTDFFWSLSDLNNGATNSDEVATFNTGESGSLFLYYSTNGPADSNLDVGAFLDIATTNAGVIQFTNAETFDFSITTGGQNFNNRWQYAGMTGTVTDDFVDELVAFVVASGTGILESNTGPVVFDEGYDAGSDSFLFGRIDFLVIGEGGSSTEISTVAGDGLIVNGSMIVDASFGGATINVVAPIPEPSTCVVMTFLLIGLSRRRSR